MSAPSYGKRWPATAALWDRAKTRPSKVHEVAVTAKRLLANKSRYQAIEKKTGVPWYVIAVIHEREASGRFDRQLAQGDPLNRRSTNEPIAGPFPSFEASAVWALHHDHMDKVIDWRVEKELCWEEGFNGWGYANNHPSIPSPYIWGGSTVQKPGKYIRDHVWSSTVMDEQLGTAVLMKALADLDHSIVFRRETPLGTPGDEGHPVEPPTPLNQVDTSEKVKKPPFPIPTSSSTPPPPPPLPKPGGVWGWITRTRS